MLGVFRKTFNSLDVTPKKQVELSLFLLSDADNTDKILLASHSGKRLMPQFLL